MLRGLQFSRHTCQGSHNQARATRNSRTPEASPNQQVWCTYHLQRSQMLWKADDQSQKAKGKHCVLLTL